MTEEEFLELVRKHQVYRHTLYLLKNIEDAKNMTQETFSTDSKKVYSGSEKPIKRLQLTLNVFFFPNNILLMRNETHYANGGSRRNF